MTQLLISRYRNKELRMEYRFGEDQFYLTCAKRQPHRQRTVKNVNASRPTRMETQQVRLRHLPRGAAEEALVDLWLCVTEHRLQVPRILFEVSSRDCVSLVISASDSPEAPAVYRAWARRHQIRWGRPSSAKLRRKARGPSLGHSPAPAPELACPRLLPTN